MKNIKKDFPIFQNYPSLVYLDSAATTQKPHVVINALSNFYQKTNANVHRGLYKLSLLAEEKYENARKLTAEFINAAKTEEIIMTHNTNYAINIVAYGWARKFLKKNDIIVLTEMEHNANVVPWLALKEQLGIKIFFIKINNNYELSIDNFLEENKKYPDFTFEKIKLISLTHASNVLGTVNNLTKIITFFKRKTNAKILIDAAQSIPHFRIDVQNLGIDFIAFSSHKMLGPSGVGILWGRKELLENMDPFIYGSHMVEAVNKQEASWATLPDKFEPGTPNIEGVSAYYEALKYIAKFDPKTIQQFEEKLTTYALQKLLNEKNIILYGKKTTDSRLGIFSFNIKGVHPHDTAQILDSDNIAIRVGHHCAGVTMQALGINSCARASLYLYNTTLDIDRLILGIRKVRKVLKLD